jgi:hypothetical protein
MIMYEAAANSLFRANDSKSVRCLALWALKRRHVHPHSFEKQVLNGNNRWVNQLKSKIGDETLNGQQSSLEGVIGQLKTGEKHSAVDHG